MKRDVDLIRQLLFDIERQGAECSLDALRTAAQHENDERLRYHLRLVIDAGLAKEIDRSASGVPSVRLTSAGHEFLDICRGDDRWRAAKWIVHEQTGGLSLTVLRAVLTKWAIDGIARSERRRRWQRSYRPYYERDYYRGEPIYRVDSYRYEREPPFEDEPSVIRARRDYREATGSRELWDHEPASAEPMIADEQLGVSLPINMI
jgi:hypothetical protein